MLATTKSRTVALCLLNILILPVSAHVSGGRPGYGLIGYGISMYKPTCAYACRDAISSPLECDDGSNSMMDGMDMDMDMGADMHMDETSPECYATNTPFLQTLAYCISTHCKQVDAWELEKYWQLNVAGRQTVQPSPKWTYQQALATVRETPNVTAPAEDHLKVASLVDEDSYLAAFNADTTFEKAESVHEAYALVLIITGAAIPIAFSLIRLIPFPKVLVSRFYATFVDPPLFGSKHRQPILNTATMPTRGQAFLIAYFIIINVVLSAAGYTISSPNAWYSQQNVQVTTYIANRAGVLSVANLALLILYSGRNNILLWVTDWSHSTFLLLHRWVAAICMLQACLHSAMYLQLYKSPTSENDYNTESKLPYWYWGIISTLAMVLLMPFSILQFRRKMYEAFLASHVVLAFFACIGFYLHIFYRFERQWGYETWVYIAFAFWGFDRLVRVLRLARNGIKTAQVTIVDDDYVRLDIPDITASGNAYLYFPTLTWRVWENHPFSVASGLVARQPTHSHANAEIVSQQPEKTTAQASVTSQGSASSETSTTRHLSPGITFFIRGQTGLTQALRARKTLPVLIESSYGQSIAHAEASPNFVCIAGGVGITAALPLLARHIGRKKLYWSVRSSALVDATRDTREDLGLANLDSEIVVGKRLDVQAILRDEIAAADAAHEEITVVVSGPPEMADDVRVNVARFAKNAQYASVRFVEESYSW